MLRYHGVPTTRAASGGPELAFVKYYPPTRAIRAYLKSGHTVESGLQTVLEGVTRLESMATQKKRHEKVKAVKIGVKALPVVTSERTRLR